MAKPHFFRDASRRFTYENPNVESKEFAVACRAIADAFQLVPEYESFVSGMDEMFWDFRRDELVIGMDWDIWLQFMVVAKSDRAVPLVRDIGIWMNSSPWGSSGT